MKDYWILRLEETIDKSLAAPTEQSRIAYLKLAQHYCGMYSSLTGQAANPRPYTQI